MPIPRRTGNAIVCASSVTGVQGDMGPQAWEETDSLPPNVRGPSGELLSAGRGRWRTLPSWLTRSTHRFGEVREYFLPRVDVGGCPGPRARGATSAAVVFDPTRGGSAAMAATVHPAANLPPMGRGTKTTTPAWMGRGGKIPALSPGGYGNRSGPGSSRKGSSYSRQLWRTQR